MDAVRGIFARENGQGMFFEMEEAVVDEGQNSDDKSKSVEDVSSEDASNNRKNKKPTLTIVK